MYPRSERRSVVASATATSPDASACSNDLTPTRRVPPESLRAFGPGVGAAHPFGDGVRDGVERL